jgi:hypothetical protein
MLDRDQFGALRRFPRSPEGECSTDVDSGPSGGLELGVALAASEFGATLEMLGPRPTGRSSGDG